MNQWKPFKKSRAITRARLFTRLTNAGRAIHRTPKRYNLSLLVFLSSDFLLYKNRSSCFFSFSICGKSRSCGSLCFFFFWLFLYLLYNQELFFSRPSRVEVVVKNELYHVKKNPFKCIKNYYFWWKQSRQFVSSAVKKQTKSTSTCVVAFLVT